MFHIEPEDWGRYSEKVDQALSEVLALKQRLEDVREEAGEQMWALALAIMAGLFVLGASVIGAVLLAIMTR